jgi:uncharacterized membrane protein YccC
MPGLCHEIRLAVGAALPLIVYGIRLSASVSLALFIAFILELDNAYWAATSASIVCLPSLGSSLQKGKFRALGTTIGAVVVVIFAVPFVQSRAGLLAGLTFWCATCGFMATLLRNYAAYAAALSGYTAAIIFSNAIDNQGQMFQIAVARATDICIGIVSAGLVLILSDMGGARRRLASELGAVCKSIAEGIALTLKDGADPDASVFRRRVLIRRVMGMDAMINEAIGEASDLRSRSSILRVATQGLVSALSAWRGLGNHLNTLAMGAEVAAPFSASISVAAEGDWKQDPGKIRDNCLAERARVLTFEARDVSSGLLIEEVAEALLAIARVANVLVLLTMPGQEKADSAKRDWSVPDVLPAAVNAARIFISLTAIEVFWIMTNWSGGQGAITFTAIAVILFSPQAYKGYATASRYAVGTALAVFLAAVLNFIVFPHLQGFEELIAILTIVFIPAGALAAGSWQPAVFSALVQNLMPILTPANVETYDLKAFLNSALPILAGTIIAAVSLRIIPPVPPDFQVRRLVTLSLRDMRRLASKNRISNRAVWTSHLSRRLADLPEPASLTNVARLVAILSVGKAIIQIRENYDNLEYHEPLTNGLNSIAHGDVAGARSAFAQFERCCEKDALQKHLSVRISAAVIEESLVRHPDLFGSRVGHTIPPTSQVRSMDR